MAKAQTAARRTLKKKAKQPTVWLPAKENYMIILTGVVVIIAGYILMSMGGVEDALALVIAPLVLIVGYCVIIPVGILYRKKESESRKD